MKARLKPRRAGLKACSYDDLAEEMMAQARA